MRNSATADALACHDSVDRGEAPDPRVTPSPQGNAQSSCSGFWTQISLRGIPGPLFAGRWPVGAALQSDELRRTADGSNSGSGVPGGTPAVRDGHGIFRILAGAAKGRGRAVEP